MQLWTFAALLILQCLIPLAVGYSHMLDVNSLGNVGTADFKGSKLSVFEIDGVQVAEPRVSFADSCASIRFNHLYLKYQLSIPLHIDVNTLPSPTDSSKKVGRVTLTELNVTADKALSSKDSKVTAVAHLKRSGGGLLMLLCDTFIRCQHLRDEVASNPEELWRAVKLVPVGRVGGNTLLFGPISSSNSPALSCEPGRWVVFQRRVDGSLSFAQNWDAYVKGFGNPKSNYWMGLDRLFAMTVTGDKHEYDDSSRCRLRIETTDFKGKNYWGEYKLFEVLGPEQNYRLRVGDEVSGSQFQDFFDYHNDMQFSTYDRDHDKTPSTSCSQLYGFGGWWYGHCHSSNLNGAYTTDSDINNNPAYTTAYLTLNNRGKVHVIYTPMKSTLMKFRCH